MSGDPHDRLATTLKELENAGLQAVAGQMERLTGRPAARGLSHGHYRVDWPLPELAQFRTPIKGLYMAGACMHPGGGIAGAAGWNCAQRLRNEAAR